LGNIEVPEGVKFLAHEETTIASVKGVKEVVAAPEAEGEGEEVLEEGAEQSEEE
jgi:hypothetical protein